MPLISTYPSHLYYYSLRNLYRFFLLIFFDNLCIGAQRVRNKWVRQTRQPNPLSVTYSNNIRKANSDHGKQTTIKTQPTKLSGLLDIKRTIDRYQNYIVFPVLLKALGVLLTNET